MSKKLELSQKERQEIEKNVEDLEMTTSGEIVVYIAKESDNYSDAIWYLSAIHSFLGCFSLALISYFWMLPEGIGAIEASIFIMSGGFVGLLLPLIIRPLRVLLMQAKTVTKRVNTRAYDVFFLNELFLTNDRVGILFYISGLEKKITILADSGINKKITQENLDSLVSDISSGIKSGNFSEGIIKAIHECKKLLLENGFSHKSGDVNELRNQVISEFDD